MPPELGKSMKDFHAEAPPEPSEEALGAAVDAEQEVSPLAVEYQRIRVRAALRAAYAVDFPSRTAPASDCCRACGCTEQRACYREDPDGSIETCAWAEPGLCTACAPGAVEDWHHPPEYGGAEA